MVVVVVVVVVVVGNGKFTVLGIVIGIFGIIGVSTNYFSYKKILKNSKEKYAQDIIRLANEIATKDEERNFEVQGNHEPIISNELYEEAQELISKISKKEKNIIFNC